MYHIIEDEGEWPRDTCNSLGQTVSRCLAITTDCAQKQVEDKLGIIATDSLTGNLPCLPVPAEYGLGDGVYEWL